MNGTTVLLVDDDDDLIDALGSALSLEGFTLATASDGAEAVATFEREQPDVVVLDLVMPGMSGLDVCRQLRRRSRVPIVMISGRDVEAEVVALLQAGADDYIVKPFGVAELVARIRAAVRRSGAVGASAGSERMQVGDLSVDVERRRASRRGQPLALSAAEFDILSVLVGHQGHIVTRAALAGDAWSADPAAARKQLDERIRRLREKLDGASASIVTVRGVGFRLEPSE